MALTALAGKKIKKRAPRARAKTGLAAAPIEKGFDAVKDYFHMEMDRKDIASQIKTYIKNNYNKSDSRAALACPEYKFSMTHLGATAFWNNQKLEESDKSIQFTRHLNDKISIMIEMGKQILLEKKADVVTNVVTLSPQQRLQNKISNTIMQDLLGLEDDWIEGEKTTINIYDLFKKHGLAGSATLVVRPVIEGWLLDYEDAYHKRCEQAVEGYSHLKRPELNRRIKACQDMLLDLDRIKSAAKATRKTRVKQPKAADKQIKNVKYKTEDNTFKLVSIPPIQIIGKMRLYTFNTKTRMITEYITQSANGFEISGSTIKNIDTVNSRTVKLRKPEEFLTLVQNKTPKQIDAEWNKLTTKSSVPNGRINVDTILLRVLDK
jgi:hypothetical protein